MGRLRNPLTMMKAWTKVLIFALAAMLAASCASKTEVVPEPTAESKKKDEYVNPFEPGTYDHFKAEKAYPKTSRVWKNESVLSRTNPSNSRLVIRKGIQRAFLMNGDEVAMDYPISSGKSGYVTPSGSFTILEKTVDKKSNAYGKVFDENGDRVSGKEKPSDVPEGGSFDGAPMPYWLRLTNDGVGHHVGAVPRYPASHGCIRGPRAVMPLVYRKVKLGTKVTVE